MIEKIHNSFIKLSDYCNRESFKGYDPYDGLNSELFKALPVLSENRIIRLFWIQLFKRSPINLRPISAVRKDYNAKALGLFLSGYCNLYNVSATSGHLDKINYFTNQLHSLVSKKWSGLCWGYNFDWQARAFFQPKDTPTVVASVFVACALLDAYEITGEERLLETARSTCDFVLKDLNRSCDEEGNFAFSYSPLDKSVVFNASLLGSRLLARVYSYTHENELMEAARKSVVFCCDHQQPDGSWYYGTLHFHRWVDNFHTGYNLECIADYMKFTRDKAPSEYLERGFNFYIKTFFTEEGIPRYYNNSLYPIDIHSAAQLIITLSKLDKIRHFDHLVDKVLNWTIDNMQSDTGYFYYQINKLYTTKISYMRWSQAWMFYAISEYLLIGGKK
jgi:hypothetical protein